MATTTFLSSGDLTADRRYEWGREFAARGDIESAADLYAQAVEIAPSYAAAWFALGEARESLGDRGGAVAAFERAAALDPDDRHGARLHLMRLGALATGEMPKNYVRTLFDGYASRFDHALTEGLKYKAPALLLRALAAAGPLQFDRVLDLGCGTGLAGEAIAAHAKTIVGVDLSSGMLAEARAKGVYARLEEADVVAFMRAEAAAGVTYDLVVAADVFVYIHDLAPVAVAMGRVMAKGARAAFSVETHDGDGVILRDTLRYAHPAAHVRAAFENAGFRLCSLESASTRTEKGVPVQGLIVVAQS